MVNFDNSSRAIYLQIVDRVCDEILAGRYAEGQRLPSVRELAGMLQVNANTVMRSYDRLASDCIIANRRGIGYFVAEDASEHVRNLKIASLIDNQMEGIFRQLELLGITPAQLADQYQHFLDSQK